MESVCLTALCPGRVSVMCSVALAKAAHCHDTAAGCPCENLQYSVIIRVPTI